PDGWQGRIADPGATLQGHALEKTVTASGQRGICARRWRRTNNHLAIIRRHDRESAVNAGGLVRPADYSRGQ
ncbi:MAG: hypothetical protein E7C76_19575, partial [Pseudomonas aeruginosa]|nr:hypothetical protein [Pseudomonas aeruginosa]